MVRYDGQAKVLPDTFLKDLESGKKMILIDTKRGFVLSHEPWFLPPINSRKNFGFMHIPATMLKTDKKIQLVASGRKAYVIEG